MSESQRPDGAVVMVPRDHLAVAYDLIREIGRMSHDQDDGGNDYDLGSDHDRLQRLIEQSRDIMSMPSTAVTQQSPISGEGWQPIETLPESIQGSTEFIGFAKQGDHPGDWAICRREDVESDMWRPAHWHPLPAPPVPSVSGGEALGSNRKGDLPTEQADGAVPVWARERFSGEAFNTWAAEAQDWSGSAWIAGERTDEDDRAMRSDLYAWLCKLGCHLSAWSDLAFAQEQAVVSPSVSGEGGR